MKNTMNYKVKINKLQIKNYKSIKEITLDNLSNFSVFAGSNGVGKSNLFEALMFLRSVVEIGAEQSVLNFGGYTNIHCHKLRKEQARRCFFSISIILDETLFDYELVIHSLDSSPWLEESLKTNGTLIAQRKKPEKVIINNEDINLQLSQDQTILNLVAKDAAKLLSFLKSIRRYSIDTIKAREPDEINNSIVLASDASNLTTVLSAIEKSNPDAVEEIMETMQLIVPGLERVVIEQQRFTNSRVALFKEYNIKNRFPANLVSDGTIYALALLVITYSNLDGMILIEEPERGLHPKAIGELVGFFREKSCGMPILINTHNEAIVRNLKANELFIVDKKDNQTEIINVFNSFPQYDYSIMNLNDMLLSNLFNCGVPW